MKTILSLLTAFIGLHTENLYLSFFCLICCFISIIGPFKFQNTKN